MPVETDIPFLKQYAEIPTIVNSTIIAYRVQGGTPWRRDAGAAEAPVPNHLASTQDGT